MATTRERRARKAERLRGWAAQREEKANHAAAQVRELGSALPMGQPILAGHYSEARHRRHVAILTEMRDYAVANGTSPAEINDGGCSEFAHAAWEFADQSEEVEVIDDENDLGRGEYTHTFICFRGRYYDAEAVEGVERWEELPHFVRLAIP